MSTPTRFEKKRFVFEAAGTPLVGVLRVPAGSGQRPALIVIGPLTSVKEQAAGTYADALAARGFVTLAFDHRTFGESGGQPRQYEHPGHKAEDVRAAVAALAGLPEVDPDRIGAVGVCAGAGYMARAVADEPRIRAFGAVAGFYHDPAMQRQWMQGGFDAAVDSGRAARLRYQETGIADTIPAVGTEGDVAMPLAEAFEYYGTPRGAVPNYTNGFAVMSREVTLPYDAQSAAPSIRVPTLLIHSEKALAPPLARAFFARLAGPKREVWVESEGQIDFYDRPERFEPAADRLAEHFRETLP
jgi:fermentation-respiration switch protein FrsA (DUF1100 family)